MKGEVLEAELAVAAAQELAVLGLNLFNDLFDPRHADPPPRGRGCYCFGRLTSNEYGPELLAPDPVSV